MSKIIRVQRNTPATLSVTFYVDETPTDPDGQTVTVSAVKADGSSHTSETSANREAVGVYSHALPGQANLDHLTFSWKGAISGLDVTLTTYVEIVGGFYFSIPELRSYDTGLQKTIGGGGYKYPYATLVYWRNYVEDEFERLCRRAFVPRFYREVLTGDGSNELLLRKPERINVTKLTIDGVDEIAWVTSGEMRRDADNVFRVYLQTETFPTDSEIVIEYEYGKVPTPARIVECAKQRARGQIMSGSSRVDERATRVEVDRFGSLSLARPGIGRYQIGIPEIDTVLDQETLSSTGGIY